MLEYISICFIYNTVHSKGKVHSKKWKFTIMLFQTSMFSFFCGMQNLINWTISVMPNSFGDLCVSQNSHRCSKWWQNFKFWVNYPFKLSSWHPCGWCKFEYELQHFPVSFSLLSSFYILSLYLFSLKLEKVIAGNFMEFSVMLS